MVDNMVVHLIKRKSNNAVLFGVLEEMMEEKNLQALENDENLYIFNTNVGSLTPKEFNDYCINSLWLNKDGENFISERFQTNINKAFSKFFGSVTELESCYEHGCFGKFTNVDYSEVFTFSEEEKNTMVEEINNLIRFITVKE